MSDRNRGAASVSVIWVIALCVILVFVSLFAFVSHQNVADAEAARETAVQSTATADTRFNTEQTAYNEFSAVTGYIDAAQRGDAAAAQAQLDELKNTVATAASAGTVSEAVVALIGEYQKELREKATLNTTITQLRAELQAGADQHRTSLREKDGELADVRRELEDTRSSLNAQIVDLERQRDGLRDQVRDLDRSISELRTQNEETARIAANDAQVAQQRNSILSERLNAVERRSDTPDGTILASNSALGKAWIDRGRLDRLAMGMEFEVRNPVNGQVKGRVKVTSLEDRRAEARILTEADRYDPIASDDLIVNDVYDPGREAIAVLLGNGFGKFSENDMKVKLKEIGIVVADEVSNEVDYLILGTPFFDEDTGDPVPWESRSEYKIADSASVRVVPLRDAMGWIGL